MSLKIAILGLLSTFGDLSGYDIKQRFSESVGNVWEADLSQIYRTLDRLELDGQVHSTPDPTSSRGRKVYRVSPSGVAALREWLAEDFELEKVRNPAMLHTFFARHIPPDRFREQIGDFRKKIEVLADGYEEIEKQLDYYLEQGWEDAFYQKLTLQLGHRYTQMTLEWCDTVLHELDKKSKKEDSEWEE